METRKYIQTFFKHNKIAVSLTVGAYILSSLLNIFVSGYLQLLLDSIAQKNGMVLPHLVWIFVGIIMVNVWLVATKYIAYPNFLKRAMLQYRERLFQDLLTKDIDTFSREKTGTYLSAFTNDMIFIQENYLKNLFLFIQMIVMLLGALSLMFFYNMYLTFIAIILSILPLIASVIVGGRLAEKETQVSENNESYVASLKDILSGFNIIKTFQSEEAVQMQFNRTSQTLEQSKKQATQTEELLEGFGNLTSIMAQVGVMLVGAYFVVGENSRVTIGMVIAFTNLMNFVIQPLAAIPQILAERKAAKKLIAKLSRQLQYNSGEEGYESLVKSDNPPYIQFENVTYTYPDSESGVRRLSVILEPGKVYAVVGSSGSGKSTLLKILMKENQGYIGNVVVNQQELKTIRSESVYQNFSHIQQEVFIFDTTIENNVTMFKEFPKEAITRALAISGLMDVMTEKGTHYTVGENGKYLSGGERQRIAIARALLRNSTVLLVDEVTSALDNLTADSINQTLFSLEGTTRVVVTHRLEKQVLQRFDQILVMKQGELVEIGDFASLMAEKGYFYSLYTVEN